MLMADRVLRWLWASAGVVLAAHLTVALYHYGVAPLDCRLRELFDPAENESMGAVFLAAVLIYAAVQALARASSRAGFDRLMWAGLAATMLLLALSRVTALHRELLAAFGIAGSIIQAAVLLAALGLAAWLMANRPPGARLLLAGLCLYLMGAVVLDAASALLFPPSPVLDACRDSVSSLPRDLAAAAEAALEMAGIILFAQALSHRAPPAPPSPPQPAAA
jgi:hypothetical protein